MLIKKAWSGIPAFLLFLVVFIIGQSGLRAIQLNTEKEEVFLKILRAAYQTSCSEVPLLRNYYLPDAEIIHDGQQSTLDETIKELEQSIATLSGLTCSYQPRIRASRANEGFAYLVVRESLTIEAKEMRKREVQQICTYVFLRVGSDWKIAHDHCSTIQELTA